MGAMTCAMIYPLCLLALVLGPAPAAEARAAAHSVRPAKDLIVYGKVKNLGFEVLDEWGMNLRIKAELTLTRGAKGRAPAPVLTIWYIAHTDLPEDRELRFRLRRSEDGTYLVCREGGRGYVCR